MTDPYDNPFSEEIHNPIVYALSSADLFFERALTARQTFRVAAGTKNLLAIPASHALVSAVAKLVATALDVRIDAGRLRDSSDFEQDFIAWAASYKLALADFKEVERLGAFALTPDFHSTEPPEPPLPPVKDWATVSSQVQIDVAAWAASVRGKKGRMLIAKPSPGTGKTKCMIDTSLREQKLRQRVVMAVRTKDILLGELEPRVRKAGGMQVRLHVIQGRDESTCWNFDNVKAVQAHGYAPGSTVCSHCEYHPDVARKLRTFAVCPYYRSRQNAQNDTTTARFKLSDYPLILTTHAGYLAALQSGGGRFGKFWPCDTLMIDEDPTDAFEPEVVVAIEHLALPLPPKPEDRAAHAMAALLGASIDQAERERRAMEGQGFLANGVQSPIHGKHGSAYAGLALHDLLDRVAKGPVGQQRGFKSALQVLRDVSDSHVHPASGALHGATTAAAVSLVVPPRGLSQLGEALYDENSLRMQLRRAAYKKVHGDMPRTYSPAQVAQAMQETDEFDPVYRVRLEFSAKTREWRFVYQDFVPMLDQGTNIIIGDAYANVEHYRQVFDKPASVPSDPTYVDPVTVVNHVANFPDGTNIARIRTRANITYLLNDGWGDHAAMLAEVFRTHAGQSVVVYGHGVLRARVEKLFEDNNNFGTTEWAFENWGGGRGKDQYGNFDAVVTISDYVQNIGGMLHKVNARASRETSRMMARDRVIEAVTEGTRIVLDMNRADIAHKMTDPDTHWRIKQEHDRQNISEQAQAIHRVRGLRSPKRITVIGDAIPFTRDTLAATVTVNPAHQAKRPMLKSGQLDGSLTEDEMFDAIAQVEEHFGVWTPAFLHAFFAMEMVDFLGCVQPVTVTEGEGCDDLYRDSLVEIIVSYRRLCHPEPLCQNAVPENEPTVPLGQVGPRQVSLPLGLLKRVHFPVPEWKLLYKRAQRELWRARGACMRAAREFEFSGTYRPSWESGSHPGYTWYSRHSYRTGHLAISEMLEHQYGINKGGVLVAPNRKPFVPF